MAGLPTYTALASAGQRGRNGRAVAATLQTGRDPGRASRSRSDIQFHRSGSGRPAPPRARSPFALQSPRATPRHSAPLSGGRCCVLIGQPACIQGVRSPPRPAADRHRPTVADDATRPVKKEIQKGGGVGLGWVLSGKCNHPVEALSVVVGLRPPLQSCAVRTAGVAFSHLGRQLWLAKVAFRTESWVELGMIRWRELARPSASLLPSAADRPAPKASRLL